MLADLEALLAAVPAGALHSAYRAAILEDNVVGKGSQNGRQRSLRYLRELYILESSNVLFRSLRDLWEVDSAGRPLLAMICALTQDPALRATAPEVLSVSKGTGVASHDLEAALQRHFGNSYSDAVANKVGRNAASSWTQAGHLEGRAKKHRTKALATSGSVAFAFLIGHLTGSRGQGLFDTLWVKTLDATSAELEGLAGAASAYHREPSEMPGSKNPSPVRIRNTV